MSVQIIRPADRQAWLGPYTWEAALPASWVEAKRTGASFYFTARACKRGHVARRHAANGSCICCAAEKMKAKRVQFPEETRAKDRINRERYAEKRKINWTRWNEKHKDRLAADKSLWRSENPQAASERDSFYYQQQAEKRREYSRAYRKANPKKRAALQNKRRARQLGAEGSYTDQDIARIRDQQKDRCGFCPTRLNGAGHIDHIIALTKGGSNWPSNLQLLCAPCNISKHDKDPIDFARSRGRLL